MPSNQVPYYSGVDPVMILRELRSRLGIEPGSPLSEAGKSVVETGRQIKTAPAEAWKFLSQAPRQIPPAQGPPVAAAPTTPATAPVTPPSPAEVLGPGQFRLPSGIDPTKSVIGSMSYKGPGLGTETALSGLKAAAGGPEPRIPTEELYRQAFRPSEQIAPGAGPWAQTQLQERLGDESFQDELQRKQQEALSQQQAALTPEARQAAEEAARRAAYPAQAQGQALVQQEQLRQSGPEAQYYAELAKMMSGGLPGGVASVSKSGVRMAQIPPALLNNLQQARRLAQSQGMTNWLGQPTEAARGLDQAVVSVMAAYPVDQDIKNVVRTIMTHPDASKLTDLNQIFDSVGVDASQVTPAEQQQIQMLLSVLRGTL